MKKRYLIVFFAVLFAVTFSILIKQSLKQTQPVQNLGKETSLLPEQPMAQKEGLIRVDTPRPNTLISSPLIVKGAARGMWFFEGSFPVTLYDSSGMVIARGFATAQGEWMTTDYVPFSATLTYTKPVGSLSSGYLVLEKHNASGDPALDDMLRFGVQL